MSATLGLGVVGKLAYEELVDHSPHTTDVGPQPRATGHLGEALGNGVNEIEYPLGGIDSGIDDSTWIPPASAGERNPYLKEEAAADVSFGAGPQAGLEDAARALETLADTVPDGPRRELSEVARDNVDEALDLVNGSKERDEYGNEHPRLDVETAIQVRTLLNLARKQLIDAGADPSEAESGPGSSVPLPD